MAIILYIATSMGLFMVSQDDGNWTVAQHALHDHPLTSVAATAESIVAGAADGLWYSGDDGDTWQRVGQGFASQHVRWLVSTSNAPGLVLAGTEPADILTSKDGGLNWDHSEAVTRMRDANGWYLPYSPNAGCVRGFTIDTSGPTIQHIYAAVEVGGVLVSGQSGTQWQLVEGSDGSPDLNRDLATMIHPDVHSISVHPESTDIITAATGGGLYRSRDGGRTWHRLYRCYIRAAWVDPEDPQHIIAGPADGVSRNGRIETSNDGGDTWHLLSEGMRAPWSRHMVERFHHADEFLYAVLSNGELWVKSLHRDTWQRILEQIGQVKAMTSITKNR